MHAWLGENQPENYRHALSMDEFREMLLLYRGVDTACIVCGGLGMRVYGDTSTYMRGMGGQTLTTGVCDHCWGTGDEHRHGPDMRRIRAELRQLEDLRKGRLR